MSPRKKPAVEATVLSVSVDALARLLDLPAGVEVVDVQVDGQELALTLTGVDTTEDTIDADYTVEAGGRRRFGFFKPADSAGTDPLEEKE